MLDQNEITLKAIEDLEFKNMLSKKKTHVCYISINSGAGERESGLGQYAYANVYYVGRKERYEGPRNRY